ncbi:MAG: glucose-6-phosphate isomerase [Gaiellaceae bacterium]
MTDRSDLIDRIWERDPTVWTGADEAKWLGWLDEPRRMRERVEELTTFAQGARDDGLDTIVLLGMGGSSLGPEVLRRTFGAQALHVLDTTHPTAIRALEEHIDLDRTLFVSASKSGSTLETRSHTDYFWKKIGKGAQWIAITDPGSQLEALAKERGFRGVFHGEPTIGGRYSALSPFGIVPAALAGIDVDALLASGEEMAERCRRDEGNPGYELGHAFGTGWQEGRDKICIAETPGGFGLWAEQLVAESTGKQGKGLVPAPGESPEGPDRQAAVPEDADGPGLGGEFFRWEFAVAVTATYLEINPFDQPDVQAAKDKTNEVLASGDDLYLEPEGSIDTLVAQAREGDYLCVQAFLPPSPENDVRIAQIVRELRERTSCVVTQGYGPRYLHSTGQLHKGGPANGLFLQMVDDGGEELSIPGKPFGFRRLIRAQAAGDYESLKERGRRVARIRIEES